MKEPTKVQIIPVLDLMHGTVVRGVAGQRDSYQPIQSQLTDSTSALDVATSIRDTFGLDYLYVADLDAIVFGKPNEQTIHNLTDNGFRLLLDSGIRSTSDVESVDPTRVDSIVVALESIESVDVVTASIDEWGPQRTIFSVDLQRGLPMTRISRWQNSEPSSIVDEIVQCGVERLILLDLAAVGMGTGIPTLQLCQTIKARHPTTRIVTGGGVNSPEDLRAAQDAGADGVLIASALHDGHVTAADLNGFGP
jgi:phosphoribosylformimino-5-aminoimidazole carboxamide ribotide isomerase